MTPEKETPASQDGGNENPLETVVCGNNNSKPVSEPQAACEGPGADLADLPIYLNRKITEPINLPTVHSVEIAAWLGSSFWEHFLGAGLQRVSTN